MQQPWVGTQMPDSLAFYCKHFVCLGWFEGPKREDGKFSKEPTPYMASGFLAEAADETWLITAGHVFTNRQERDAIGISYSRPSLMDAWSPASTVNMRLPFDFFDEDCEKFVVYDEDRGIDFAAVRIPPLIKSALDQTIVPFRFIDWVESSKREYETYFLLGSPGSMADVDRSDTSSKVASITVYPCPVMARLTPLEVDSKDYRKIAESPDFPARPIADLYVAKLDDEFQLEDITGMSGGPILGFSKSEDGIRYFPVAIQCSWFKNRRVVLGTPLFHTMASFHLHMLGELDER